MPLQARNGPTHRVSRHTDVPCSSAHTRAYTRAYIGPTRLQCAYTQIRSSTHARALARRRHVPKCLHHTPTHTNHPPARTHHNALTRRHHVLARTCYAFVRTHAGTRTQQPVHARATPHTHVPRPYTHHASRFKAIYLSRKSFRENRWIFIGERYASVT